MKLRTTFEYLAPDPERYVTIDDDEYDGAEDAGQQLVGRGATAQESREDFWDQRIQRDADREIKRALKTTALWTDLINKAFQKPARCDCASNGAAAEAASNGTALAGEVMPTSSAGGRSIAQLPAR